jgi:hypothetical protein
MEQKEKKPAGPAGKPAEGRATSKPGSQGEKE